MKLVLNIAFASAALALTATSAQAQSCSSSPVFAAASGANSDVRASAVRLRQGDWSTAAHFAGEALDSGTSPRNKSAAAANLCYALTKMGDTGAASACDDAVARAGSSRWEAYNDRGAAYWLSGDLSAAAADFARAQDLGAGGAASENANALAACAS
jgi:Flp pilus assembly protein TadD